MHLSRISKITCKKWPLFLCGLLLYANLALAQNLTSFEFLSDQSDLKSFFYENNKKYLVQENYFEFTFASGPQFLNLFSSINEKSRSNTNATTAQAEVNELLNQSQDKLFQHSKFNLGVPLPYLRIKKLKSISNLTYENKKDALLEISKGLNATVAMILQQRKKYSLNSSWKYASHAPIYNFNLTHSTLSDVAATRDPTYIVARGELFTFEDAEQKGKLTALDFGGQHRLGDFNFYAGIEDIPLVSDQDNLAFQRKTAYLFSVSQNLLLYNSIYFTPMLRINYRQRSSLIDNLTAELHFSPLERTTRISASLNPNFSGLALEISFWKLELNYQLDFYYGNKYSGLPLQHQFNISVPFDH